MPYRNKDPYEAGDDEEGVDACRCTASTVCTEAVLFVGKKQKIYMCNMTDRDCRQCLCNMSTCTCVFVRLRVSAHASVRAACVRVYARICCVCACMCVRLFLNSK